MIAVTPTQYQVGLLQHSLGIREDRRTPFRNHFVAGEGHSDMPHLRELESMGLMTSQDNGTTWGGLCFYVTEAGKEIAIEKLPPERKRTRYEEYMHSECCDRFGEWLCGRRLPQFEMRDHIVNGRFRPQFRMFRFNWDYSRDVEGDWADTKKAAKASYKQKLKEKSA